MTSKLRIVHRRTACADPRTLLCSSYLGLYSNTRPRPQRPSAFVQSVHQPSKLANGATPSRLRAHLGPFYSSLFPVQVAIASRCSFLYTLHSLLSKYVCSTILFANTLRLVDHPGVSWADTHQRPSIAAHELNFSLVTFNTRVRALREDFLGSVASKCRFGIKKPEPHGTPSAPTPVARIGNMLPEARILLSTTGIVPHGRLPRSGGATFYLLLIRSGAVF